jgi:spermidine synthase
VVVALGVASLEAPPLTRALAGLRYLDAGALQSMFAIPADLGRVDVEVNRLDNQVLVRYYDAEWKRWN